MRFARFWLVASSLLVLPVVASAASLEKGASLLAIQLSRGIADANTDNGGYLLSSTWPEVGVQGQYWYFMAKEYAVNLTAGIGYFKESVTADPAVVFGGNQTYSVSSWQVRLGGDRFAQVSDKLQFFAGPGIQIWSGRLKFEDESGEAEQPSTTRYALSGRIGAQILMGENFGLMGHIGQYWGYATASEGDAETKWLPSGSEGAMGFSFAF
ncbi:MAG TPA: hypothetical protein VFQ05_08315 [Candidatus Eisenbacteria bacterium]|nr:hypothetical protein [Candidatus Eisenbacteria bacterium]